MKAVGVVGLMILVVLCLSCGKLPEQLSFEKGGIAVEELANPASIPLEWGTLISVSSSPEVQHVYQLWFQDDGGTIRMALYNRDLNKLQAEAIVIPRTGGGGTDE